MTVRILPALARGSVVLPPSKSLLQRRLIAAALCPPASGESRVLPLCSSQDIAAIRRCLQAVGVSVDAQTGKVRGCLPSDWNAATLDCGESAATLRFLIPLAAVSGREFRFTGSVRLFARPLDVYAAIAAQQGTRFSLDADGLTVAGRWKPGRFAVDCRVSSQFLSGLMMALPLMDGDSEIILLGDPVSRPYAAMTADILRQSGIALTGQDDRVVIPGRQTYRPLHSPVEADMSAAAVFAALNMLGGQVAFDTPGVTGQADALYREYYPALIVCSPTLDVTDTPDLTMLLMALAALYNGVTLTGTGRLRYKESDRAENMAAELRRFGARVTVEDDRVTVVPAALHSVSGAVDAHGDHRIAMALAVVCSQLGGEITGAESVAKSYPGFWDDLRKVGIPVEERGERRL